MMNESGADLIDSEVAIKGENVLNSANSDRADNNLLCINLRKFETIQQPLTTMYYQHMLK